MKNLVLTLFISLYGAQANQELVIIRTAYAKTASLKQELAYLKHILTTAPDRPVENCYRGAAAMMEARYAINPLTKWSAFSKGKRLIEMAIAADLNNLECRFVRYGIQRNLPTILNYHDQLKNDSTLITNRLDTLKDQDLKKRILNFMKRN